MSAEDPSTKLPAFAVNMRRVVEWLATADRNEVTTSDLAAAIGRSLSDTNLRHVARLLVKRGVLRRLYGGRYEVVRPDQEPRTLCLGDDLHHWLSPYALAYSTAMSIHGFLPALTKRTRLHILRQRPVNLRRPPGLRVDVQYHYQSEPILDVADVEHPLLGYACVRTPLRTVYDALAFPKHSGGLIAAAGYAGYALRRGSVAELVKLAPGVKRRGGICRLGLLLELAGVPPEELAGLLPYVGGRRFELDPARGPSEKLHPRWRLRMNVPLEPLKAAMARAGK